MSRTPKTIDTSDFKTVDARSLPDFPRKSKKRINLPTICGPGERVPVEIKEKIKALLLDAYYTRGEIADRCGVSRKTVENLLKKDPVLKDAYLSAWNERMQMVEVSMVERAIDGQNQIAAQAAGEFLLKHNMRDKYDDKIIAPDRLAQLPKIIVPIAVPVRTEQTIKQAEVIDVQ